MQGTKREKGGGGNKNSFFFLKVDKVAIIHKKV